MPPELGSTRVLTTGPLGKFLLSSSSFFFFLIESNNKSEAKWTNKVRGKKDPGDV